MPVSRGLNFYCLMFVPPCPMNACLFPLLHQHCTPHPPPLACFPHLLVFVSAPYVCRYAGCCLTGVLVQEEQRRFEIPRLDGVARDQACERAVVGMRQAFMRFLACALLQIKEMQSLVRVGARGQGGGVKTGGREGWW